MKRLLAIVLAVAVSTAWHTPQSYAAAWDLRFQQYDGSGVLRPGNVTVSANSVMGFDASKAPITIATSGTGSVVKQTAPTINNATLGGNTVAGNIAASGSLSGSNLSGSNTGDQLAYANIIVGNVTIPANSTAGNVTLIAGTGVTLTPDATNRTITVNVTAGGGSSGPPAQVDLANGTTLTVGTEYFDSTSANRTLTFTGTATEGEHISLTLNVSAACTWTIPASYRWGDSSSVTSIALRPGYNFLRWDRSNSLWMLTDTANSVVSLGNQTATLGSLIPIGNTTADGKTTAGALLDLGAAHITVGNNTVSANTTSNITFASANGNATLTANTSNNTITLNVTSSGGGNATYDTGMTMFIPATGAYSTPPTGWSLTGVNGIPAFTTPDADFQAIVKTAGTVSTPTFSPAAGSYSSNQTVTISTATSGATIAYTTNGTDPSRSVGSTYSTPITVSSNQTVKALAYKDYYIDSAVASAAYTITAGSGPTLIAHTGAATGVNGGATSSIDTTGANFAVIAVCWYDAVTASPTISDSKGNTWTSLTRTESNDTGVRFYYTQGGTFGTGHTFTASGTSIYSSIFVQAWSLISATPFDVENGATAVVSTTIQPGSVTPGQANVLVITATANNDSALVPSSINSSFTISDSVAVNTGTNVGGGMAYRVITDGSAQNPTWTYSGTFNDASARSATFKY